MSKEINDYNEELKILIKNIDEHIKKKEEGKQKEKEKDGGLEKQKEKEKFRKRIIQNQSQSHIGNQNIKKDLFKKKRKNIISINEISNNTISNINTTDNSKTIEARVKRLNKFKNVSKKPSLMLGKLILLVYLLKQKK